MATLGVRRDHYPLPWSKQMSRRQVYLDRAGKRPQTARMRREAAAAEERTKGTRKGYWVTNRGTIKYSGEYFAPLHKVELDKLTAEALLASGSVAETKAKAEATVAPPEPFADVAPAPLGPLE